MRRINCHTFVLAALICALHCCTANAQEEPDLLNSIKKLGGSVLRYDQELEVSFHLRGKDVTDQDLAVVSRLKDITSLNLAGTKITGKGLQHLAALSRLRRLHLEKTKIDDAGLAHLAGLKNLEYLNLYSTDITDAGLAHLTPLKKLSRLYVWQTQATDRGVAMLEKASPDLRIVRGVDLSKLPNYAEVEAAKPKPKINLKWVASTNRSDAPKSITGVNVQVIFENRSKKPVKVFWVSYGDELVLYAELKANETHQQNTYSKNTWLITDADDRQLGYFIVGDELARAIIPE